MVSLKAVQLKFLLKLLACENYRARLVEIKPNSKTPAADRNRACEDLVSMGYVECSREIAEFVIGASGKALLNKGADELPIQPSAQEVKVLEAAKEKITPGKLGKKVPKEERQDLIQNLADRGLLKIEKTTIQDVWLSAQGRQFLQDEYEPKGNWTITATTLGSYLNFLRSSSSQRASAPSLPTGQPRSQRPLSQPGSQPNSAMPIGSGSKPDAQAVLQQIKQLDQLIGAENYLPIYHLREKLQTQLTREELDSRLYELQRNDKIELSSLHDQGDYSDHQISAGIAQNHGRSLFFIAVL